MDCMTTLLDFCYYLNYISDLPNTALQNLVAQCTSTSDFMCYVYIKRLPFFCLLFSYISFVSFLFPGHFTFGFWSVDYELK
jgi:hypothetical protein